MGFLAKIGVKKSRDGRSKHVLYKHWKSMMGIAYCREKQIGVCSKWHDFWSFASDLSGLYDEKYKYLCRIDASKEWQLGNVWFTNSPKKMIYGRKTTHKVQVGKIRLTTRQVKQDLEAKGINLAHQTITNRVRENKEILKSNAHKNYFHNGKMVSLKAVSELENIDYPTLKYYAKSLKLEDAILRTKKEIKRQRFYEYDGQKLNQTQLSIYLSKINTKLTAESIRNKLKKGLTPEECLR